jgi:hypothetical protein
MKRDVSLKKIYRQNPETKAYLIEVALDRYEEIFNEWDPAPYKRRDLNPALLRYLEDSSEDVPFHNDVELLFKAPAQISNDSKEWSALDGLKTWLACAEDAARKSLRRLRTRSLTYLGAAAVLLTVVAYLSRIHVESLWLTVVRDGLTIGSWVFAWELISIFLFRRVELLRELKKWKRLAKAQVSFTYHKQPDSDLDAKPR